MVDLSALLQDLSDCIASKHDSSSETQEEDVPVVDSRFRAVLPVLVDAYFLPEKVKGREISAILKLVKHTVENFPGVLFHGRCHAVLPLVARLIPLLAEPASSGCGELLFETLRALITLLRTAEWEVFQYFFIDAMLLVEDLVAVGSFFSAPTKNTTSAAISVTCFQESFAFLQESNDDRFIGLSRWESSDRAGLTIDVGANSRWENLAVYAIKILTHFLAEESFHVRGLVTSGFMYAVGTIMCFGSSNLHKACYEMFAVGTSELDDDVVPREKAILSILTVLSSCKNGELPSYRTSTYDSSLGSSLLSLYSTSSPEIIESTAPEFINIFSKSTMMSSSRDLKVALCSILSIILRHCPAYSSTILSFTELIFVPDIVYSFSSCLQIAVATMSADVGDLEHSSKRRKLQEGEALHSGVGRSFDYMHQVVGRLETESKNSSMPVENLVAGYCVLARSVCRSPGSTFLRAVLQQFCEWLIVLKAKALVTTFTKTQLSLILEAVDGLVFCPESEIPESLFGRVTDAVLHVLEIPFSRVLDSQVESTRKTKLYVMTMLAKIKDPEKFNADRLLHLGLNDEDIRIRSAAVTCIPLLIAHSSLRWLKITEILRNLEGGNELDREALASIMGQMFCLASGKVTSSSDLQQLTCDICDCGKITNAAATGVDYEYWKSIAVKLLLTDPAHRVQSTMVRNLSRIFTHIFEADVREIWIKCLNVLPLHPDRSVRKGFCSQIRCLTEQRIWNCTAGHKSDAYEFLNKIEYGIVVSAEVEVFETLVETLAEVGKLAKDGNLRNAALILLVQQLNHHQTSARTFTVKLICEIAAAQFPSDGNCVEKMVESSSGDLFEFLSTCLGRQQIIIEEFAEAVMKITVGDLLRKMIPFVLPKLILDQQQNDETSIRKLNALAHLLQTTLPLVLTDWSPKVLAVLLLRANGKELMAALQFYESQTGLDTREIFAAVLPELLYELVLFLGDISDEEAIRRSARVWPMIQEVARVVSGSDDLSSFLNRHLVHLLNNMGNLLHSDEIKLQKQALKCIERLIEMISSNINAFIPKIMALLSQRQDLQLESLSAWLSFVKSLARASPGNLRSVASQIVVALMPYLESEQPSTIEAAVKVLEELILINRRLLGDQLKELPILPSMKDLAAVNAVLDEVRGVSSLRDQLIRAADGLNHESLSLRLVTATELLKLLSSKRNDIATLVLGETPADADAVSTLVTRLLRGCSEESRAASRFTLICAECLGCIGAIDPVKLQISLRHRSSMAHTEENLVLQLINQHLTRVLRAASEGAHDAAALAIQELLKISKCHEWASAKSASTSSSSKPSQKNNASRGDRLWNRFSEAVKEIITPCLVSRYLLRGAGAPIPTGPIFRQGILFKRWMSLWCRRLLSQVTGQMSPILNACSGVVRYDMDTALYVLPYLILDVVCQGSDEARDGVTKEILAVLAEAGNDPQSGQPVYVNNAVCGSGGEVCMQTVFMLLDTLGQWIDDSAALIGSGSRTAGAKALAARLTTECEKVGQFLGSIPKQSLASASFRCRAYARALLYYESYVRDKSGAVNPAALVSGTFNDEDVGFLLKIYGGLDEVDGVLGIARLQKRASLEDQVLINKISGNWAEALTCCEQALELEPRSLYWQSGVLDCLVNMGHFQAMVTHVDGLRVRLPDSRREWCMRGVQAAWRLGQWDLIDEYVRGAEIEPGNSNSDNDSAFDLSLAKVLQALRTKDRIRFQEQLTNSRLSLLAPLAAASMESYVRSYPVVVKLHMLRELEDFFPMIDRGGGDDVPVRIGLFEDWNGRLKMTLPSLSTREPILALRRLLFSVCDLQSEMGSCWLQYAKLCRISGHYETANRAILQAQAAGAPDAHRERAKLFWDTKKQHRAIDELQQVLVSVPASVLGSASAAALTGLVAKPRSESEVVVSGSEQVKTDAAKTLLLLGRWSHCTGQKQKEEVIGIYTRVKDLQPVWEKGYFYLAKYYDDLLVDARKRQEEMKDRRTKRSVDDQLWWTYLPDAVLYYAKGLHKSHHRLFQALPRLLTLWFDFGSTYHGQNLGSNKLLKAAHVRVMSIMRGCLQELPSYQWLSSLPQLVSRICHDNEEIVKLVKQIIRNVLQAYPQQALWTMAAVSKSTVLERRNAAAEIIQAAKSATFDSGVRAVFTDFATFLDHMVRLCFAPGPHEKSKSLSLSTSDFGSLKRMMPLQIIMPVQRALAVTLPADGLANSSYNPFPAGDCSTIFAIRDHVEILVSLQRPKKVVLVASDGTQHPFLCKPKDDLRKDARMMEFTGMINRLLSKDPSSRRRKLYIRTFAVIPLTEDCGMVEWVSHTRGFRPIVQDLYASAGIFDKDKTNIKVKRYYDENDEKKMSVTVLMRDKILPMFPPVFHKWFLGTFPEPTAWFQSRLAYARTTAVWSMVGHIVGLGDRHGDNILYDSATGDCVHVDFSCLFDRGLNLERPELVPFRLTQNMVDGLGITGYEGVFLQTCEITLSVLRANRETLMNVLETFIHDPLVEWTTSHKSSATEVQNPHAQRALANIKARLQGVVVGVGAAPSLPLSVEGQARRLIQEAVSHENLGHMFIWWMPWI